MQNLCPHCKSPIPADAPGGLCPACVLLGVAGPTNPSQAAASNAPTIEEVTAAFPELEVLELIGQGGMGVVFKARQPRLDRLVALKILPPALAAQPGFAERFTREARVLAKLAHPHIVAIYDFGESAGFFYLIMEFVNGVNLRAAMRAGVKPEQALLLVPRICEALQFAHDHGVLHRDIKPENILLDTTGTPKLADFGIAKLAGEESAKTGLTATGAALGTAAYMAPEQVEKPSTVDHRADIYSLGVVLYEMLTGELPLGRFAAPSEKSSVNRGVDEVVMRALEKERERRQQSATDLKTQVEGASHPGVRPLAAAHTAPTQDPRVKRIFLALCVLSAVGIPLTNMLGWHAPNPRHMVMFTILFGTLAALSKLFASPMALPARPRILPDPAPNPWPHRLAWLIAGMFALPVVAILSFLLIPALHRGSLSAGWGAAFASMLPFIAGAALFYGYRRTQPGPDRATPRSTWNPWPKRAFLLIALLVGLPMALVGVGLAIPMIAYRGAERPVRTVKLKPQRTFSVVATVTPDRAPFIGELQQGSLELVSISPHPANDQRGWRMDSSPVNEGPFVNRGAKSTPQPGERAYDFVFRIRNLPPNSSTPTWHLSDAHSWAGGGTPFLAAQTPDPNQPAQPEAPVPDCTVISATFPEKVRKTNIRMGVAAARWTTLSESRPGNSIAVSLSHEGENWNVAQLSTVEAKDGEVVVTYAASPHENWQTRVVAVTVEGKEIPASRSSSLNENSEWRFEHLPMKNINQFRFQARRYDWVEFRGVALAPSKKGGNPPRNAAAPATKDSASSGIMRLQDEAIRSAHARLDETKKLFETGLATQLDMLAAERNLAVTEARDDELKVATALATYAEMRSNLVKEQVKQGLATPLEGLNAEQELNTARIRLEKARDKAGIKQDAGLEKSDNP